MNILGIDPGLTTTGLGILEIGLRRVVLSADWLTIQTSASLPLPDRLTELHRDLTTFLLETKPDAAVVEQIFFAKNKRTAIDVAHARGVIILSLHLQGIPVLSATPLQLKTAITGDGRADKKQMRMMVQRILKLKSFLGPADAADALALALYGAYSLKKL